MRRLFIAVAAILALTAFGSAAAADRAVSITRTAFSPADVTIAVGDTVTWRNTDTALTGRFTRQPATGRSSPARPGMHLRAEALKYREPSRRATPLEGRNGDRSRTSASKAARAMHVPFRWPFGSSRAGSERPVES